MKKKFTTSFDELIKNHYGGSVQSDLSNTVRVEELFANYYGKSAVRRDGNRGTPPPVVLSLSCDDGETVAQHPQGKRFEEYVAQYSLADAEFEEYIVERSALLAQSPVAAKAEVLSVEEVSAFQEYQVDVLEPLREANAPDSRTAAHTSPSEAVVPPSREDRPQRQAVAPQLPPSSQKASRAQAADDDFIADMQSILSGQMVFNPVTKQTVAKDEPNRTFTSPTDVNERPVATAKNELAIFDRIAQSMEYANKYDLGTVELENRFSDFDRIAELQQKAKEAISKNGQTPSGQSSPAATVDSADFIQDLDAIRKQRSATSAPSETPAPSLSAATETGTVLTTNIEFGNRNLAETAANSTVLSSPMYDRKGALEYARKFWLLPCDDQFIALSASAGKDFQMVPAGTKLEHEFDGKTSKQREHAVLPDGTRIEWAALDDCTHFISCCIGERKGEPCGNLPIPYKQLGEPPEAPYGITRVSSMVDFLTGKKVKGVKYAEIVAEKSEDEKVIGTLSPGDLIAYFHKKNKQYSHLAMYLGDNKIACHTYSRSDSKECTWDNIWNIGVGTHQWTFIRFTL